jgi:IS1 family transposase
MTFVDRRTRCYMAWEASFARGQALLQSMLDRTVQADHYYSDQFPTYHNLLYYPGQHHPMPDKSQTYSVEAGNAELRHYLARLARRSRCFSRSLSALQSAIRVFVFAFNQRQLYRLAHPNYPAHLLDFISPIS